MTRKLRLQRKDAWVKVEHAFRNIYIHMYVCMYVYMYIYIYAYVYKVMQEEASQLAKDMHVLHDKPSGQGQTLRTRQETARRKVRAKHAQERLMKQVMAVCMHAIKYNAFMCMFTRTIQKQTGLSLFT